MFNIVDGVLRISVRHLVEFIYRTGDIDNRFGSVPDTEAMRAGAKIHKKIQKKMGSKYRSEVFLKDEFECEDYSIVVEGRADGIFEQEDLFVIDEIKGMYANVMNIEEPIYVHKAQAMCYAYFYAKQNNLEQIGLQLTYVNLDTEDINRLFEVFEFKELHLWYEKTMEMFKKWSDFVKVSKEKRTESIKDLKFPYEYRKGQKDLAVSVYKTINRRKVLFIQAPTGVGKTLSTVYPSVMAVGEGLGDKIFYLTAKTITRTVALEAFNLLKEKGLRFRTIIITSKEKICDYELQCNPAACLCAQGHFDRVNDAVYDIICNEDSITREIVKEYAKKHNVCPFEMSLDISYWCDGIICDYNYVFDPNAYLRRYFADGAVGDYIFLVDEAHNLVERAREMYSAVISKESVMECKRIVKNVDAKLYRALERVNKSLLEIKRTIDSECIVMESCGSLILSSINLYDELVRFNEENRNFEYKDKMTEFFFEVRDFINTAELLDEKYLIYAWMDKYEDVKVKLFCVDPSNNINHCIGKGKSAVFFSATFLPINYYKSLIRDSEDDYAVYAHSPFDPHKRKVLIATDVTTKYTQRNSASYRKVYEYVKKTVKCKVGNYLVFFPSYGYLEEVLQYYCNEDFDLICQEQEMSESDKEEFLNKFEVTERKRSFVGFCVMGGIFSEGIDLKEESLIGAVIVGNGLPQISMERNLLMNWFAKEEKGFEYAYMYPGLNKVLQSAGRVIRTENDRGVIVLLENRFLNGDYEGMFPAEWSNMDVTDINGIEEELKEFW